jgi:hypothetical protein
MQARSYLINSVKSSLGIRELLISAGVNVVDQKPEEGDYIDLSPEALDKTTFLGLL